jgi:cytochrome c oxidase assembly protein subunit 15
MLLRLRLVHPALALIAALFALWLAALARRKRSSHTGSNASDSGEFNQTAIRVQQASRAHLANLLLILLGLQLVLGVADVLLLAPAWMQLLHLLGADLFWIALIQLAAWTIWPDAQISAGVPSTPAVTTN